MNLLFSAFSTDLSLSSTLLMHFADEVALTAEPPGVVL